MAAESVQWASAQARRGPFCRRMDGGGEGGIYPPVPPGGKNEKRGNLMIRFVVFKRKSYKKRLRNEVCIALAQKKFLK